MSNFSKVLDGEMSQAESIGKALCICVTQLPSKTRVYAMLLASLSSLELRNSLLGRVADRLDAALEANLWIEIKLLVRFYAELVTVGLAVHGDLLAVYASLLEKKNDAHVFVVLASLPHVGPSPC